MTSSLMASLVVDINKTIYHGKGKRELQRWKERPGCILREIARIRVQYTRIEH